MTIIREFAPAKINLTLEVLGKRPDGYHELASLIAFARDAADVVELDTSAPASVTVVGPYGGSIAGENLVDVTLRKLAASSPDLRLGAVRLTKNLPVAAGIGGGSADAAAVIRAVQKANPSFAKSVDWLAIASSLGADVPVCLFDRPAWVTGIGERVEPMETLGALAAILINPLQPMPANKTARVFKTLNAPERRYPNMAPPLPGPFLHEPMVLEFMKRYGNALEAAAAQVAPVITELMDILKQVPGCRHVAMSGAGPTCFGAGLGNFEDDVARIAKAHPHWWIVCSRIC